MFSRFTAFLFILFTGTVPLAAKVPEQSAATQLASPALWEVRSPSSKGKLYLFGTFHLLPKSIEWQTKTFEKSAKSSKAFVFELTEADMKNPENQQLLLSRGMLPSGQTLDQLVGPALFAKVEVAGKAVGVPMVVLNRMRPWMASVLLAVQSAKAAGFEPGLGVEAILQARAAKANMPVTSLETMAEQVDALAAMDDDGGRQMLEETAAELVTAEKTFAQMLAAWASGDSRTIEAAFLNDMQSHPKAYDALLKQRNLRWLPKLEGLLAGRGPALVAVGAGHLVGPDGIVALLRAKGYQIKQVQPK
jgi:uncharacterized protein